MRHVLALPLLLAVLPACSGAGGGWESVGALARPTPPAVITQAPLSTATATPTQAASEDVIVVRYRVEDRTADAATNDFAAFVEAVLEDPRGWQQADFELIHDPTAEYLVVLAEAGEVDALCLPYDTGGRFSCQNGHVVALNADRWRTATETWPRTLGDYRTMLVNHEFGHLLGMHHIRCKQAGTPAPVMEQQSGGLRGCLPNPWPTPVEIMLAATHQFRLAPPPLER